MSYMTVRQTAEAAKAIYKNNDFEGFTMLGGFFDPKNNDRLGWAKEGDAGGGSAGIYKYNVGKDMFILSFRGSKGGKDWKVDDVQIGLNMTVDRASDCIKYARQLQWQYQGAFILVAGHSLGGFLAQVVGVECDLPFITYNAPPAGRAFSGSRAAKRFDKGVNLRVNWDPVSRAPGRHIGPLITMPHVGMKLHDAHTSAAFMRSIDQAAYKDLPAMAFITAANRH
ncbi:Mbeg1-like protein [Plastoroseomonas hellenica]|uniref:Mbeg1-like protein n=1 Tax=Plastoroseomonas hellenica TaxID=2687306 RepID=UPI001BA574BB|nr:Mbeg1-like protein [Plastoroseomonas hellenica]MBR0647281.1 DUF2974 domain-containing protein [Plastoroseomonas hellenica]